MDDVLTYQRQLLAQARQVYRHTPLSDATTQAYLAMPRHLFVRRYREWASTEWRDVHPSNLLQHAATLYEDKALILFGDDDDAIPSTISQPSFVLRMLDLLQLQPGQRVLELGTGSGWNAALIGHLVGPAGRVYSLEIIPDLARRAAETLTEVGITNVQAIAADGGDGYLPGGPYDRVTFTAGTYDLARPFYAQVTEGGLLLVVIKNAGGGDNLFVLRKMGDHFESVYSMPCGFVPLRGKYRNEGLEPTVLEALPEWATLQHQEVARRPFWWGGKGREHFVWQTLGIRSFLSITEPWFRAFKVPKASRDAMDDHYFGLWDREHGSLVLAEHDGLVAYGNTVASERLLRQLHRWVDLGMPTAASLRLQVYPGDRDLAVRDDQWVVTREESQFVWSVPV